MPFIFSRTTRPYLALCVCLSLLLATFSIQAQDGLSTQEADPAPLVTEVISADELPTEAAATEVTPQPTQDITPSATDVTPVLTEAVAPIVTQEITPAATDEPTAVPTITDTVITPVETLPTATAQILLPMAFAATFDAGYPADLSPNTGWIEVAVTNGKALQTGSGAVSVSYTQATFTDAAVEASVLLNSGEGQVMLGAYTAGLAADGTLTLLYNQTTILTASAELAPNAWVVLRLQRVASQITVLVNNTVMIDTQAEDTLEGRVGFAASSSAILRIDNFAVYGIPTTAVSVTPAVTAAASPVPIKTEVAAAPALPGNPLPMACDANAASRTLVGSPVYPSVGMSTVSTGGQFVLSITSSNGVPQLYRYDRQTCESQVVSQSSDNIEGNGRTTSGSMSSTGRMIAFVSKADNLVASDTNSKADVFVRDMDTNAVTLISANNGIQGSDASDAPVMSLDGRFVVFSSAASNLASVPDNNSSNDLFLIDLNVSTALQTISVTGDNSETAVGFWISSDVTSNGDNAYVAYVDGSGGGLYLRDVSNQITTQISTSAMIPFVSPVRVRNDGTSLFVLFYTAQGLDAADTNNVTDLYIYKAALNNLANGTTLLVSRANGTEGAVDENGFQGRSWISGNGHVVFMGTASQTLAAGEPLLVIRDVIQSITARVPSLLGTTSALSDSPVIDISSDGTYVNANQAVVDGNTYGTVGALPLGTLSGNWSQSGISLSLNGLAGASSYSIKRKNPDNGLFEEVAPLQPSNPTITYTVSIIISCSQTYDYLVQVQRMDGTLTDSNLASINTPTCGAPTPLTPTNGALINSLMPRITWTEVLGTQFYEVDVSTSSTFTSHIMGYPAMTNSTMQDLSVIPGNGKYYWKVRALLPNPTAYSPVYAFTLDTIPPGTPIPTAPINGATVRTPRPTFTWTAAATATSYSLVIDDEPLFLEPYLYSKTNISTTSFTLPEALPQGISYWRVTAYDAAKNSASINTSMQIVVDPALSPLAGAIIPLVGTSDTASVLFKWTGVPNTSYTVQLDTVNGTFTPALLTTCSTPVVASGTTYSCTITGLSRGSYVWRVLRASETPLTLVSDAFSVSVAAPRAPRLLTPTTGKYLTSAEQQTTHLTWDWGTTTTPTGSPFTYQVELSASSTFATMPIQQVATTDDTQSIDLGTLAEGVYYWRARAINKDSAAGAWSAGFKFIVDNHSPDVPTLTVPNTEEVISNIRPTFKWGAVPGAARYELKVVSEWNCENSPTTYYSISTTATTVTMPSTAAALPQGTLYACLRAYDLSENVSSYGGSSYGGPQPFGLFIGTTPLDSSFIAPGISPTFKWVGTPGQKYTLQISTNTIFTAPFVRDNITTLSYTLTAQELAQALPTSGRYYWRVLRQGETPNGLAYSRLFVATMTDGPTLISPSADQVIDTTTTDLTWNSATAPTGISGTINTYEVQVATTSTFTLPLMSQSTVTSGQNTFSLTLGNKDNVTYYWRVRGRQGTLPVTNWSTGRFIADNIPLTAPTITSPASGTDVLVSTLRPVVTWNAVPGALRYSVSVLDNVSLTSLVTTQTVTGLSFTMPVNLPQSSVTVFVEALDDIHTSTTASAYFTVRLGNTPAEGATVTARTVAFAWTAVTGVTSPRYTLQIDDDPNFMTPFTKDNLATAAYTLTAAEGLQTLPDDGRYYWRVKLNTAGYDYPDNLGAHAFSLNTVLKATNPATHSLSSIAPEAKVFNAATDNPIVFTWNVPTVVPTAYELQLSRSSAFTTILSSVLISDIPLIGLPTFYEMAENTLTDGTYYWRIKARFNISGLTYSLSDIKSFTLDTHAPAAPQTVSNERYLTARPTFKWIGTSEAVRYRLTVYDVIGAVTEEIYVPIPGLSNLLITAPTASYTIPLTIAALSQDRTYAWDVTAEDTFGNTSTSTRWTFDVALAKTPVSAAFSIDTTPTFTWTPVTGIGAATWTLQIATSEDMTQNLRTVSSLPSTSSSYTPTIPLSVGTYYWRVYRATEVPEGVGIVSLYIVSSPASITPTPLSPANNQLFNAMSSITGYSFLWTPLSAPANVAFVDYRVAIYKVRPTTTNCSDVGALTWFSTSNIPETWMPASPLQDGTYYWQLCGRFGPQADVGPAAATRSFIVDTQAPGAPTLTLPIDTARLTTSRTPMFTWTAATGTPARYIVQIDTDNDFGNGSLYGWTVSAAVRSDTPTASTALPNGSYVWRVTALDAAGNVTSSSTRTLVIQVP